MATRSLTPKRQAERMQRFHSAVRTIALFKAKNAVQAQIRARGERISDYSCRDISLMAHDHLAQNREELIARATAWVASWPEFSPFVCAYVATNAQNQKPQTSMGSAVQISGAK